MIRRIRALVFRFQKLRKEEEARIEATHDDSKGMALREVELEQVRFRGVRIGSRIQGGCSAHRSNLHGVQGELEQVRRLLSD